MSLYTIIRLTGDYPDRQREATEAGAILYLEQHCNASTDPRICYPAGLYRGDVDAARGMALAAEYAAVVAETCPVPMSPPRPVALLTSSRGYGNLRHLGPNVVGCLMEPGHVSHPPFAAWAKSAEGVEALARAIVHVVRGACPKGGTIALSVGHAGKVSEPTDRGAPVFGGGWESDLATAVVDRAADILREG